MKAFKKQLKKIIDICFKPYMRILPGNVAYSLMMSIIPILSIIVMICNFINLSPDFLVDRVGDVIPHNILNILLQYMNGSTFNSIILIIAGIWGASGGANALIIASNIIYDYEKENFVARKIKAFIMTLLLIVVVIINLVFLVFGNDLLGGILNLFNVSTDIIPLFSFVKWPIALVLVYIIIKLLYTACPDRRIKSRTVTKGAIFTTTVWMLSSAIYSYYATNIANYSRVYGGLANIIILMIWLYILSYILVVGFAINVSEYNKQLKLEESMNKDKK